MKDWRICAFAEVMHMVTKNKELKKLKKFSLRQREAEEAKKVSLCQIGAEKAKKVSLAKQV
jgi:hypothetical protein